MDYSSRDSVEAAGFTGFKKVSELFLNKALIPPAKGVYMVLYPSHEYPEFLFPGSGPALYKKKTDPNVPIEFLRGRWVEKSPVLYIGKAGGLNQKGLEGTETLRSRLSTYLNFGQGRDVGHYGGRLIWQLKNYQDLLVCWKPTPAENPREIEKDLIRRFEDIYGKRPLANIQA